MSHGLPEMMPSRSSLAPRQQTRARWALISGRPTDSGIGHHAAATIGKYVVAAAHNSARP